MIRIQYQLQLLIIQRQMTSNKQQTTAQIAAIFCQIQEISLSDIPDLSLQILFDFKPSESYIQNQQQYSDQYDYEAVGQIFEPEIININRTCQLKPQDTIKTLTDAISWNATFLINREKLFKRSRFDQKQEIIALGKEVEALQLKSLHENQGSIQACMGNQNNCNYILPVNRFIKKDIFIRCQNKKEEKLEFRWQDIEKLSPRLDLNDIIIQNYLKIVKSHFLPEELSMKIHFFSTFFFEKLLGQANIAAYLELPNMLTKNQLEKLKLKVGDNYTKIKRWTKNTDVFEKQLLILPINAFNHWFCVIVLNPNNIFSQIGVDRPTQIIYCDSMFEKKDFIVQSVKEYLRLELENKKGKFIRPFEQNACSYQLLLPRQTNTHDCGLYMLAYIDEILSNGYQRLKSFKNIQNRIQLNLFPRKLIFTMRQRLLRLIDELVVAESSEKTQEILQKFQEAKKAILERKEKYDEINEQQFFKYKATILCNNQKANTSAEEAEFGLLIRFYLDSDVNYYQKDNQLQ